MNTALAYSSNFKKHLPKPSHCNHAVCACMNAYNVIHGKTQSSGEYDNIV